MRYGDGCPNRTAICAPGDERRSRCAASQGVLAFERIVADLIPPPRRADLHQLGLPAVLFAPAQVHAQQHLGPVLGLGAAGAGLDIEEGVGFVELAGEHAAEFQLLDPCRSHRHRRRLTRQCRYRPHRPPWTADRRHRSDRTPALPCCRRRFERGAFAPRTCAAPGRSRCRVFEFAQDLGQAFLLALVVKDTPEGLGRPLRSAILQVMGLMSAC